MDRTILHCDCNGFFASVECMDRPELKRVPMAVAGDPKSRTGIILAKNELAKGFGIKTAETVYAARRKCPQLVLVPPRHFRYREVSRQVNQMYQCYTDQVEHFGIDESWLDVSGSLKLLRTTGPQLADALRARVREQIGITISVGVSFCKILAKMGSDLKKPDATTTITRENFKKIIWPLPAGDLLFVGNTTAALLAKHSIRTVGDIARTDQAVLSSLLGKSGAMLWRYANGLDDDPVKSISEREALKSIGNGMTFPQDLTTRAEMRAGVTLLADEVAMRMRKHGVKCFTLQVHLKDKALKTTSRQVTLRCATQLHSELVNEAMKLISRYWREGTPVRAITLTAAGLIGEDEDCAQLTLFDDGQQARREKREKLEAAVYSIRNRFGTDSISMGAPKAVVGGRKPSGEDAKQTWRGGNLSDSDSNKTE
jgi:DNA polymerase-4